MRWFPSWQSILISFVVMSSVRAAWIWRKYDNHRFLRFIGWPEPYGRSGSKEYYWTSGTSGASGAEIERALSPEYAEKHKWLMTVRARCLIIGANVLAWSLVIYGGFDLPGGLSLSNSHLSWWGVAPMLTWWLSRVSARVIADAPDELLDERLLAIRNAAYHEAYRLLGLVVSLIVIVAIALDISITETTREFGVADWTSLSVSLPFVAIWAVSSLPSLVLIAKQSADV
jgi:hypothetical protein